MWITGLPGSGKTTIATSVCDYLRKRNSAVVQLDGDIFREITANDLGYSIEDRLTNAWRIVRLCRVLAEQGLVVVCATASLFRKIHEWNRANFPRYLEIYLRVDNETLLKRNADGLIGATLEKGGRNLIGLDQPFDEPECPDLVIENVDTGPKVSDSAERIAALVEL